MSGFLSDVIRRYPPDDPHLEDLARWIAHTGDVAMAGSPDERACRGCRALINPCWCNGAARPHWVDRAGTHDCAPIGAVRRTAHEPGDDPVYMVAPPPERRSVQQDQHSDDQRGEERDREQNQ